MVDKQRMRFWDVGGGQVVMLARECEGLKVTLQSLQTALAAAGDNKSVQGQLSASIKTVADLENKVSFENM